MVRRHRALTVAQPLHDPGCGATVVADDASCPFCEIVEREDPDAREIYRDEHVIAFFPDEPATLGHTLVIPRSHVPDVWSLDERLAGSLARAVLHVAHAIRRAMTPEGLNIIQSNGQVATQTVFHMHVHVVPRWTSDAIGRIWPPEAQYTEAEVDDAWERLRIECRRGAADVPTPPSG